MMAIKKPPKNQKKQLAYQKNKKPPKNWLAMLAELL